MEPDPLEELDQHVDGRDPGQKAADEEDERGVDGAGADAQPQFHAQRRPERELPGQKRNGRTIAAGFPEKGSEIRHRVDRDDFYLPGLFHPVGPDEAVQRELRRVIEGKAGQHHFPQRGDRDHEAQRLGPVRFVQLLQRIDG